MRINHHAPSPLPRNKIPAAISTPPPGSFIRAGSQGHSHACADLSAQDSLRRRRDGGSGSDAHWIGRPSFCLIYIQASLDHFSYDDFSRVKAKRATPVPGHMPPDLLLYPSLSFRICTGFRPLRAKAGPKSWQDGERFSSASRLGFRLCVTDKGGLRRERIGIGGRDRGHHRRSASDYRKLRVAAEPAGPDS